MVMVHPILMYHPFLPWCFRTKTWWRPERCTKRTGGGGKVVVDVEVVKVVDMVVVVTVVFVADLLANNDKQASHTHRIHVWYVYLRLAKMYGKCR